MKNLRLFIKAMRYKFADRALKKFTGVTWHKSFLLYPFRLFFHPIDTFNDLKYEGKSSMIIANTLAALFFLVRLLQQTSTAYLFTTSDAKKTSIVTVLAISLGVLLIWTICNFATGTFLGGEGTIKDIWIATTYSLMPYIMFTGLNIILSYFFTKTESTFYNFFAVFGLGWTLMLLFLGVLVVHQYTVARTVASFATSFGLIFCFVFLIFLFMSIYQQVYSFFTNIIRELIVR